MVMATRTDDVATGESTVTGAKKQATVPQEIREAAGIDRGDKIKWVYKDGQITVRKKEGQ